LYAEKRDRKYERAALKYLARYARIQRGTPRIWEGAISLDHDYVADVIVISPDGTIRHEPGRRDQGRDDYGD
jgi:hypothetical protein